MADPNINVTFDGTQGVVTINNGFGTYNNTNNTTSLTAPLSTTATLYATPRTGYRFVRFDITNTPITYTARITTQFYDTIANRIVTGTYGKIVVRYNDGTVPIDPKKIPLDNLNAVKENGYGVSISTTYPYVVIDAIPNTTNWNYVYAEGFDGVNPISTGRFCCESNFAVDINRFPEIVVRFEGIASTGGGGGGGKQPTY